MATTIKNSGIEIYSVGVGIGGQTIKKYIDQIKWQKCHFFFDKKRHISKK